MVDDHEIARDGVKLQLEHLADHARVDEAGSCTEAIELARVHVYDLVLLDLLLPDSRGLDTLRRFLSVGTNAPVVVVSGATDSSLVREAVDAGAVGFIPKRASRTEFVSALRVILDGGIFIPNDALTAQIDAKAGPPSTERLTERQLQVLRGAIAGKPNKIIAAELDLSTHTVKAHLSAAMRVLGASNRTEAVFKSAALGIPVFSKASS